MPGLAHPPPENERPGEETGAQVLEQEPSPKHTYSLWIAQGGHP